MRRLNEELDKMESVNLDELKYVTVQLPYSKEKYATIKVPRFLVNAFTFLHEQKYLEIEGIFRKQGNTSKITGTEACFVSGEIDPTLSVVDVCVLIKRFIKSIRGGLFAAKDDRLIGMAFGPDGSETPNTLCHFCHTLPTYNYGILAYIVFQLARVIRHSDANKMDAENLAIIFVPVMFKIYEQKLMHGSLNIEQIKENQKTLKPMVAMLIKNFTMAPPIILRNSFINRLPRSQPNVASTTNKPTTPGKAIAQRSASVATNKPVIAIPRYTHAAAPNVAKPRGAAALADQKNKERTGLRAARKRSKSIVRGVINFVTGTNEQYCVNENVDPTKSLSRRSRIIRRNTSS
ncbi:Rho-GAP domain-containing protein [Aphelenchoides bicaudatus]|nr:Rho-GAP domain-containing protein [Aphelenchoides bicaudatus]